MNEDISQKIEEQGKKIDEIYQSVERLRKYFMWTLIITCAAIVLPLIGMALVIPSLINTLGSAYGL